MNKLIIDNVDELSNLIIHEDTDLFISLKDSCGYININVADNVCLSILELGNNTKNHVEFNLGENSKVITTRLCINTSDNIKINLNGKYSSINYNTSIINEYDNTYTELINHNCSNTSSLISNHAINIGSNDFILDIDAKVQSDSNDCDTNQDNKIINRSCGRSIIKPNLLVDNNLIDASHSAYIGNFNPNTIFYLQTRGIPKEKIEQLLIVGFLLEKMNLQEHDKEKVISVINEYIRGGENNES